MRFFNISAMGPSFGDQVPLLSGFSHVIWNRMYGAVPKVSRRDESRFTPIAGELALPSRFISSASDLELAVIPLMCTTYSLGALPALAAAAIAFALRAPRASMLMYSRQ